jgi:tRNA (guanine37-N1)-methyltransferase
VLGDEMSAVEESFGQNGLLEAAQYTKPAEFAGLKVPDILLGGNHAKIAAWRHEHALERTKQVRPDLLQQPDCQVPGTRAASAATARP